MGCGASSKPKPLDDAQRVNVCIAVAKEMMIYCVPRAMADPSKIVVPAPSEINNLKSSVTDLRNAAEKLKESGSDAAQAQEKKPAAKGMLGALASVADQVADAVQDVAGQTGSMMLNTCANALEESIKAIEEPFTRIGKEIVEKKKDSISKVFEIHIGNLKMQNDAVALVRGESPYGAEQLKNVKTDAISCYLTGKADKNLSAALMKEVEEELKKSSAVQVWDSAIIKFNNASDKINSIQFCKDNKIELQSFKLDIKEHIVDKCVESICGLLGAEEAQARASPAEKSRKPKTFAMVFSGEPLDTRVTSALKEEEQALAH